MFESYIAGNTSNVIVMAHKQNNWIHLNDHTIMMGMVSL